MGWAETATWTYFSPAGGGPGPRDGQTAVYDSASNELILFGGTNNQETVTFNDIWILKNANGMAGTPVWQKLFPMGGPPQGKIVQQRHLRSRKQCNDDLWRCYWCRVRALQRTILGFYADANRTGGSSRMEHFSQSVRRSALSGLSTPRSMSFQEHNDHLRRRTAER